MGSTILYQSGGLENPYPIVLYDYQATRAGKHAQTFLQGFAGYLQTDGYAGYHILASAICIQVGCMAQTALSKFARLYALEKEIKGLPIGQRYGHRQERKLSM